MSKNSVWIMAKYATHTFHYRMPDTVAISSVNPVLPSPLTVQMAMVASYLREGDAVKAQALLDLMPLNVRVRLPKAALVFRNIMRYVRPPKDPFDVDKSSGSSYKISPHFREYALLQDGIEVYVETVTENAERVREALEKIPYLGAKDSLVSCEAIQLVDMPPDDCAVNVASEDFKAEPRDAIILQLADFEPERDKRVPSLTLENLIPGQRDKRHYRIDAYFAPGRVESQGNVKLFKRGT
jgi:hypothetical protein